MILSSSQLLQGLQAVCSKLTVSNGLLKVKLKNGIILSPDFSEQLKEHKQDIIKLYESSQWFTRLYRSDKQRLLNLAEKYARICWHMGSGTNVLEQVESARRYIDDCPDMPGLCEWIHDLQIIE